MTKIGALKVPGMYFYGPCHLNRGTMSILVKYSQYSLIKRTNCQLSNLNIESEVPARTLNIFQKELNASTDE